MIPDIPTQRDLWSRVRLAQSLLSHRALDADTALLLRAVLDGVPPQWLPSVRTETSVKPETNPTDQNETQGTPR